MTNPAQLDRPELVRLWDRIADRLQRNGLQVHGAVQLDGLAREERHALAGLLGRPVTGSRLRVDLAQVDQRLRDSEASPRGLVALVESLRGPLVNRPAARLAATEARNAVWAVLHRELSAARLDDEPWVPAWLEDLRRNGTLSRLAPPRAAQVAGQAVAVLAQLPGLTRGRRGSQAVDLSSVGRNDVASQVAGDAHGLDDGTHLSAAVLRAVALAVGRPYSQAPAHRRDLWSSVGVRADEVSTTVLTAGLRPPGGGPGETWLRERSDRGWETHLTWRDIDRIDWAGRGGTAEVRPGDARSDHIVSDGSHSDLQGAPARLRRAADELVVSVCENPRVLEAALDAGSRAALVCTQGNPSVLVHVLLERLAEAGHRFRYHGDFDWPGLIIANGLMSRSDCVPWRFGAEDYEDALASVGAQVGDLPLLEGDPVDASWEGALRSTMARRGRVVHEELVLDTLLSDLGR